MPTLRKCLTRPGAYLAVIALAALAVTADSFRPPDQEWSVDVYLAMVHGYQRAGSPALEGYVRCRYRPTCSRYSAEAVEKYGLRKGLAMTAARLWRCRKSVPLGTGDPVP
jgi:putative membrane protein insertion efficiency factor